MYFWDITGLLQDLRTNKVKRGEVFMYVALLSITFALSLNVINLLPTLYQFLFGYAKTYLEGQAAPTPLTVTVYHYFNTPFLNLKLAICLVGIIFCFFVHKGTIKQFVTRIIALSWPITFRIMIVTGLLFLLFTTLLGIYFGYKLLMITKAEPTRPKVLKLLKFLIKATVAYPIGKAIWAQGQNLATAQVIFNQISRTSYVMYWGAHVTALFSTMWWMLTLQEKIRKIK